MRQISNERITVMQVIPTLGSGGAENMVLQLSSGLMKYKNIRIIIVSLYDKEFAAPDRLDFASKNDIEIVYLKKRKGFDYSIIKKLKELVIDEGVNIVHTHLSAFQYVLYINSKKSIKHIHTVHSIVGRENPIYEMCFRYASHRKMTCFIALTDSIRKELIRRYRTDERMVTCIPNGIDTNKYFYRERVSVNDAITFITVGSLIPVKNHELLLNAFKEFCTIRNYVDKLYIVGDGVLKEQLVNFTNQNGLSNNVIFTGNVGDVENYLYKADVFVLTSHYEGVSLALLEASSTGLAIIASSTGGTPEVVGEDALLIADNDKDELVNKMKMLAENHEQRQYYQRTARKIAERNSLHNMVQEYHKKYLELLSE